MTSHKLPTDERRSKQLHVPLRESELQELKAHSRRLDRKTADWVREVALREARTDVPNPCPRPSSGSSVTEENPK